MTHELWLLRHGQSTGNLQGLRQGRQEYPLSDQGRRQVKALAARWRSADPGFDALITSPLKRAAQTAAILGEALGQHAEENPLWVERDAGRASGKPLSPDPEQRAAPQRAPAYLPPSPGAESRLALHLRAGQAIQAILERPSGRYLVVAHGGILVAAVRATLGLLPSGNAVQPGLAFDNAGFAVVRMDEGRGHWVLERLNDTCHLKT